MRYFAFVRRDQDGRYTATFPDLPGLAVSSTSFRQLQKKLGPAAREHLASQPDTPMPMDRMRSLPRSEGDHEGFWLEVDA
jgi:predicted RNase H-like HicB family nuclease